MSLDIAFISFDHINGQKCLNCTSESISLVTYVCDWTYVTLQCIENLQFCQPVFIFIVLIFQMTQDYAERVVLITLVSTDDIINKAKKNNSHDDVLKAVLKAEWEKSINPNRDAGTL